MLLLLTNSTAVGSFIETWNQKTFWSKWVIRHCARLLFWHAKVSMANFCSFFWIFNCLLTLQHNSLKLGDFGSCRSVYSKPPHTEYISTRWYRAPECLLTDGYYSFKMDMWSTGCVFYEIMRYVLHWINFVLESWGHLPFHRDHPQTHPHQIWGF